MRALWRRALDRWSASALPVALALLFPSVCSAATSLLPQDVGTSAATGRSVTDAIGQNENALIDQEVLGAPPPGRSAPGGAEGGAGSAGGSATTEVGSYQTGRARGSSHDGLRGGDPLTNYSYHTNEVSAFGNIVVTMPGTVLGGQVKFSGFLGRNELWLNLKSNAIAILDPNQSGSATNESIIAGGTALWALKSTYALATIAGTWGQTTLKDAVNDCGYLVPPSPTGCNHQRYNYNTSGFIGNVTAGHVFDLAGASGPKLDLRGSVGFSRINGARFRDKNVINLALPIGQQDESFLGTLTFSTWTGTAAATLFSNLALQDNSLLRPYIQGYVRQELVYRNEVEIAASVAGLGVVPLLTNSYQQDHFYGGVDAGLTYTQGNTTVGAAIYYEASGDERTLGGRLGVSQKLDDLVGAAQAKRFNWSGFYVGVNAGGAFGDARASTSMTCGGVILPGCLFADPQFAAIGTAGTGTLSDRGFTGGAQAGLNTQTGSAIFGLEIDVQSFKLAASRSVTTANPTVAGDFITVGASFDSNWLFTARSRLGLAVVPDVLLYGTIGLAVTELSVRNSLSSTLSLGQGADNDSGKRVGWTIGGGAEWTLNRNWSVRAEYLYLDFGKVTANALINDPNNPAHTGTNNLATTVDLTAQVVRAGVNYKF